MVNPIEQNNNNTTISNSLNNPDETLKNTLSSTQYSMQPKEETISPNSKPIQMSMNKTETLPPVTHEIETENLSTLESILKKGPAYEYVDNLGNHGKLGKITTDANGHVSIANQDVTHAVTGKPLGLFVIEGDPPPLPPAVRANASSSGSGDPHFVGLNGSHFDFQGIPGHIFNILSDAKIQVNALFNPWGNGATAMGQIGIRLGKDNLLVNPGRSTSLNGSALGQGQSVKLKEGTISVNGNVTSISTKEYSINVYNGGNHLDIGITTTAEGVNRDGVMPGGVIGQTASGGLNLSVGDFLVYDGIFGTGCKSNKFGSKTNADILKDKIKEKYSIS